MKKMILVCCCTLLAGALLSADSAPEAPFIKMTQEEIRAYEIDTLRRISDLALIPPEINTSPLPKYDYDKLDYGMTIGIERTPGGRLWACWVAGEDGPKAFFVVNRSDDDGESWSKPCLVIDAHAPDRIPMPRSTLVGNFWTSPDGALRLFFSQSMLGADGRAGTWETVCRNPDAPEPQWSAPRRIWHGYLLNKPTLLSNGEWLLPIEFPVHHGRGLFKEVHKDLASLRGANVFVSADQGQSWSRRGCLRFPNPNWDEHMFVELKDGRVWMLARTGKGIMQSFSADQGRTWSEPSWPNFKHPVARFFIRRLASGRILLVKHGRTIDTEEGRSWLSAWLSEDDGASWTGGLILDERKSISYPDGFQAPDGMIYISYDRNRSTDGEILLARFSEEDVLAGKIVSPRSKLKMLISRPLKREIKISRKVKRSDNADAQPLLTAPVAELRVPEHAQIRKLKLGDSIYSNRDYVFHEFPAQLEGRNFVFSDLEHTSAIGVKEGMVYALCSTPQRNPQDNPEKQLLDQGFVRAAVPEFVITLINGVERPQETCSLYQKLLKAGEEISFGRWGVLAF